MASWTTSNSQKCNKENTGIITMVTGIAYIPRIGGSATRQIRRRYLKFELKFLISNFSLNFLEFQISNLNFEFQKFGRSPLEFKNVLESWLESGCIKYVQSRD